MKVLIVLSAVVAVSLAKPGYLAGGIAGYAAPVAYSSYAPVAASVQHHAQDALGQYNYGYADGLSTKNEVKTYDGVTRGGYSYVDPNGEIQSVSYTADAANGFQVSATNLPQAPAPIEAPELKAPEPVQDTPEVAAAKAAHSVAVENAAALAAAAPAPVAVSAVVAAPAIGYSSIAAPAIGYSSIAAPAIGYSSIAAPAIVSAVAPSRAFAYSSVAAAPAIGYSSIAGHPIGYSSIAGHPIGYSSIAGHHIGYSSIAAPAVNVVPAADAVPAGLVLTAQGVPVDTPAVQIARAADTAAHLRAKGLIF